MVVYPNLGLNPQYLARPTPIGPGERARLWALAVESKTGWSGLRFLPPEADTKSF